MRLRGVQQELAKRIEGIDRELAGLDLMPTLPRTGHVARARLIPLCASVSSPTGGSDWVMCDQVSGELLQMFSLTQTRFPRGVPQGPLLH